MLHEPAAQAGKDPAFPYKRRLGVKLFFGYAFIYAVFIAINVINPKGMELEMFNGLNLAVVFGFGLILLAFAVALIYNAMCGAREKAYDLGKE